MDADFEQALCHTNTIMAGINTAPQSHQKQVADAGLSWIEERAEGIGG